MSSTSTQGEVAPEQEKSLFGYQRVKATGELIQLAYAPGVHVTVSSAPFVGHPGVEVVLETGAPLSVTSTYMSADEARRVAVALAHAADYYDRQRAALGARA